MMSKLFGQLIDNFGINKNLRNVNIFSLNYPDIKHKNAYVEPMIKSTDKVK